MFRVTIQQGMPIATRRRIYFTAVSDVNLQARQTGLSNGGWTARWKKPDAVEAAAAGTFGEEDAADMPGSYYYEPTLAEIAVPGTGTARWGRANIEPREFAVDIIPAYFGTVQAGTLSPTGFTTDLTQATGHWTDAFVRFLTGTLAGQVKKIGGFTNAGGLVLLANGKTFTGAPVATDVFELITR